MNVHTPERYDERTFHLAVGVEPRDAATGQRLASSVDVRIEDAPAPLAAWRPWRPGEVLTPYLGRLPRRRSGRFGALYDAGTRTPVRLRIVEDAVAGSRRLPGEGRRIVPRRVEIAIADEATVLAAEADPATAPVPVWQRTAPVWCFPGASAPLPSRATVVRGRLVRDDGSALAPVRWARVRADNVDGDPVGWAHGDDRGEFVLVVEPTAGGVVIPDDPLSVTLTVGAALPPMGPGDLADPFRAEVDPLWDLPVETLTLAADPAAEPSLTGRRFLPGHVQLSPLSPAPPINLPLGRETSLTVQIA